MTYFKGTLITATFDAQITDNLGNFTLQKENTPGYQLPASILDYATNVILREPQLDTNQWVKDQSGNIYINKPDSSFPNSPLLLLVDSTGAIPTNPSRTDWNSLTFPQMVQVSP